MTKIDNQASDFTCDKFLTLLQVTTMIDNQESYFTCDKVFTLLQIMTKTDNEASDLPVTNCSLFYK